MKDRLGMALGVCLQEMLQRWKKETEARRSHAERVSREASVSKALTSWPGLGASAVAGAESGSRGA